MMHLLLAVIYLSFISLGLPDSLLGSAWPSMYGQFGVPVSYAGILSMIIAMGTVVSSLQSDRLTHRLGTGKVTLFSVAMTALALFGFSTSHSFWMLCLWAVPYGLGAGSVDASLNNYVALHYASCHMSWLHCMWGIGASAGPYVMGYALAGGQSWNLGYGYISFLQIGLTLVLLASLPLWRLKTREKEGAAAFRQVPAKQAETPAAGRGGNKPLSLRNILRISGAKEIMLVFFCYCALEQTAGLWASSYMVLHGGLSVQKAAGFASLFYIGITVGRVISGFLSIKFGDEQMVRLGLGIIGVGIVTLLLPFGTYSMLAGLILIGLGCAPVYPSIIHSTPDHFGAGRSQAMIGVQMASAYVGTCLMPPAFGLVANHLGAALFPFYLCGMLAVMVVMHERMVKKTEGCVLAQEGGAL